jgi:hypothetical protein
MPHDTVRGDDHFREPPQTGLGAEPAPCPLRSARQAVGEWTAESIADEPDRLGWT